MMRSDEIIRGIVQGRREGKSFIKWWRIENDFTDYELLDSFIEHAGSGDEFAGYELLDTEQMWTELKRWKPSGLKRHRTVHGEQIEWQRKSAGGTLNTETRPFTPEAIMEIFDEETGGDVLL